MKPARTPKLSLIGRYEYSKSRSLFGSLRKSFPLLFGDSWGPCFPICHFCSWCFHWNAKASDNTTPITPKDLKSFKDFVRVPVCTGSSLLPPDGSCQKRVRLSVLWFVYRFCTFPLSPAPTSAWQIVSTLLNWNICWITFFILPLYSLPGSLNVVYLH